MSSFFQRIKRLLSASPLGTALMKYRVRRAKTRPYAAYNVMKEFGYGNLSDSQKKALFKDMRHWLKKYHYSFYEYFAYNFIETKSEQERLAFVSNYERRTIILRLNRPEDKQTFDNKLIAASKFSEFFKRYCCGIESLEDVDKLEKFLTKYKRVIVKPIGSSWGHGVRIVEVKDENNVRELAASIIKEYDRRSGLNFYGGIVEEVVVQDEPFAKLHPQSVNSIRITTIRLDTETVIFEPFLRVGRGDSCVDNAGSGGIICPLNPETGTVFAARDERGVAYETQPETGERLVGFQVPRWDEAKDFVLKAAQVVPTTRIIAWDVALTPDGWILLEANYAGEWLTQEATRHGLRGKLNEILRELGE